MGMQIGAVVYRGSTCSVGRFRCPVSFPRFHDTGPIDTYLIVFPRTSVAITQAGADPVVADPNIVMLYNPGQEYRRDPISIRGYQCELFGPSMDAVLDAIRPFDPSVDERPNRPFRMTHAPCPARTYALQRAMYERIARGEHIEAFEFEELALRLVQEVIEAGHRARGDQPIRTATRRAHQELVETTKATLADSFGKAWTLDRLARSVHASAYHLCRVFRRETGQSVHGYLEQLRLRSALEQLADGAGDLSLLAAELGYSSHSHFTQAFRRAFAVTPSAYRDAPERLAQFEQ
jgi:AraC-like DNA-binding protein